MIRRVYKREIIEGLKQSVVFDGFVARSSIPPWKLDIHGYLIHAETEQEFIRAVYQAEDSFIIGGKDGRGLTYWKIVFR